MIRLHVRDPLTAHETFDLEPAQSHYLSHVMRQKAGAEILAFNGRDGEWACVILEGRKRSLRLQPVRRTRSQPEPPRLELLCALLKRNRLEMIIEKAVELGVGRIRLLRTRRTNYDHPNLERLRAIAAEASEQTGRLDVPEVDEPGRLEEVVTARPEGAALIFCDEAGDAPGEPWGGAAGRAPDALGVLLREGGPGAGPAGVLIGPEGGFDPEERSWLRARSGVRPVSLGPRILRTDTAAIAALVLVQAAIGDWRGEPVGEPLP